MKKKWYVMAAIMLTCSSAGCSKGEENKLPADDSKGENVNIEKSVEEDGKGTLGNSENHTETNANAQQFPNEYQYESEFLDIDITNITPSEVVWYNVKCKTYPLDYEKIGRIFMPDDGTNEMDKDGHIILSKESVDGIYNEMFSWGPMGCGYHSMEASLLSCSLRTDMRYDDYNLDVYKEKKDFSFGTEEEVQKILYDEFNKIGINLEKDFVCDTYYLDYNIMKDQELYVYMGEEDEEIHPNRVDWSENDNAYYMFFHQTCNNVRDFQGTDMGNNNAMNDNAQIKIIYNKDGIIECNIGSISEYYISDNQVELMEFEDVMSSIIEHYSNVVDETKRKIVSAELISGCVDHSSTERKLLPVWAFWVEEEGNEDGFVHKHELRVNAKTGKVIN